MADKRKSQMAPIRPTTVLKPDPVDELEKVALTGIEEVRRYILQTGAIWKINEFGDSDLLETVTFKI
jgi:hypothetical protein